MNRFSQIKREAASSRNKFSASFQNFKRLQEQAQSVQKAPLSKQTKFFSLLMSKTSGRDQICRLLQYNAQLYHLMTDNTKFGFSKSRKIAENIEKSMKSGRKIFNFLRFFNEIGILRKIIANKDKNPTIALSILSCLCSFFFHLCNNILWGVQIGVLSDFFSERQTVIWKMRKDTFSFLKVMFNFVENGILYRISSRKEDTLWRKLEKFKHIKTITNMNQDVLTLAKQLIDQRRSRRFQLLFEAQSVLRFICLYKNLQLPGSIAIAPVFLTCCELTTTFIDLLSAYSLKHKLSMTFIGDEEVEARRANKMSVIRSTEYDWLKKEEDELEEWNQKQRKGIYKLARKFTNSATSLIQLQIE